MSAPLTWQELEQKFKSQREEKQYQRGGPRPPPPQHSPHPPPPRGPPPPPRQYGPGLAAPFPPRPGPQHHQQFPRPPPPPPPPPPAAAAASHPFPVPNGPCMIPFDNTLSNLEFHSRKNRRITYALNARQQRQFAALEMSIDERLANLQTNHKCIEDRLGGQLKVLQATQKESEQKLLVRLNDMSVKVEMCNKTIKTQLDQLGRHSRAAAGADGGHAVQKHIQEIKKSHESATSELQREFQELKRQVTCRHHKTDVLEPQLPAIDLNSLKAAHEVKASVSGDASTSHKRARADHDQTTTDPVSAVANGSQKHVVALKQPEQVSGPSQTQDKETRSSEAEKTPHEQQTAEGNATSSSSDSDASRSDDQFQDDAESLARQLRMLVAPRPNDRAQFEVFLKRVRRLMAQTPFKILKVRTIRHAKDLCLGLASEWWCDVEDEIWEEISEGHRDAENKGEEKAEGETDSPPVTPGKARNETSTSKTMAGSSPSGSGTNKTESSPSGSGSGTSKIESSPSGSNSSKKSTLAASNPFVSPCSAAIEKVLSKIGPFSGLHFDRWSRRVQAAWDANTDAEFRSELLKSLPRLLKGEPARVVAANEAFAKFDQWEAWKMALFMSLSPA